MAEAGRAPPCPHSNTPFPDKNRKQGVCEVLPQPVGYGGNKSRALNFRAVSQSLPHVPCLSEGMCTRKAQHFQQRPNRAETLAAPTCLFGSSRATHCLILPNPSPKVPSLNPRSGVSTSQHGSPLMPSSWGKAHWLSLDNSLPFRMERRDLVCDSNPEIPYPGGLTSLLTLPAFSQLDTLRRQGFWRVTDCF